MKTEGELQADDTSVVLFTTDRQGDNEDYVAIIRAMLVREKLYKSTRVKIPVVTYLRKQVYKWMLSVVDFHRLERETATIAISYLDRYVNRHIKGAACNDAVRYRFLGMVSLYIAAKINEPIPFSARSISVLSKRRYSVDDVVACENEILEGLDWLLHGPTPHGFISYWLALTPRDSSLARFASQVYANSIREVESITGYPGSNSMYSSKLAARALSKSIDGLSLLSSDEKVEFLRVVYKTMDISTISVSVQSSHIDACRVSLFRNKS